MRAYSFTNYMLNTISQGIQPGHAVNQMHVKYKDWLGPEKDILMDWSENHKTVVCLNGGNYHGVLAAHAIVADAGLELQLPFSQFHEDEQTLGGLMTSTAIIVPEYLYNITTEIRMRNPGWEMAREGLVPPVIALVNLIVASPLAR